MFTAGDQARYFSTEDSCAAQFDALLGDCDALDRMKQASFARYQAMFTWEKVLAEYEGLLAAYA